jgi:hypothetical protein
MAVRVARGLFRLCIIVSVLWIGGVAAATWKTFPPAELTDEEVGLNTRPSVMGPMRSSPPIDRHAAELTLLSVVGAEAATLCC